MNANQYFCSPLQNKRHGITNCRKKGRYKKALIKKLQVCTKQFDNDIVRCNEVAEIVIELFQFGEQIDRRHGEKLLYFIKRSKYEHDLALRFKLLHKFSQQGDL
ncbi:MAG: hypothetical protein NTY70_15665 [Burkholderiales bacterium]|nr:hypothetical protein [Burkholderiales bacterium]